MSFNIVSDSEDSSLVNRREVGVSKRRHLPWLMSNTSGLQISFKASRGPFQNRDGAIVVVKSDIHAQKHVMFPSGHGHFTKFGFNLFDNVGYYRVIHMRDLVVVNIPGNRALVRV